MNKKGFSTILLIVIIAAITMVLATTVSFLAMATLEMSSDYVADRKTQYLADSCFEEILNKIQNNNSLVLSNYSLILEDGLCIINVENISQLKSISIVANSNNYFKRIVSSISIENGLAIETYKIN